MSRFFDNYRQHRYRSRSCSAIAVAVRVSLVGAATAAAITLYRKFRFIMHNLAPSYVREFENGEDSESNRASRLAELNVAKLFEGLPGVEVYQSLRIPDPGNRGRREIDLVLLTKRDLFVLEVKNWSGPLHLHHDGSWVQIRSDGSAVVHSNLLEDLRDRADLLESYIERRGVTLPAGLLQQKLFLMNRGCRPEQAITMQPEVLSADQWEHFYRGLYKKDSKWRKTPLRSEKAERTLSEPERKQLHYILSTAPTWDRLELEGGKIVVGEFQGFKGRSSDVEVLSFAKRSNVSHMVMTHQQSWLDNLFGSPKILILVTPRDYRDGNSSKKKFQDPALQSKVRSDTEIVFQIAGTSRLQQFFLGEVLSLSLGS